MVVTDNYLKQLPKELQEILLEGGIRKFTDIQRKAYPHIFGEENLVIVSPSGSGKTLIAELISIVDLLDSQENLYNRYDSLQQEGLTKLEKRKLREEMTFDAKTIFLVPLRALAEEKANHLAKMYRKFGVKVHMSMSEVDFNEEEIRKCHILISTYERFRTIIGRLPSLLGKIKNVIVDEFHLIGDSHRGATLETILIALKGKTRLILLSATAANPNDIATWLNAVLISSTKRLIPLDFEIIPTFRPEVTVKKIIRDNIPLDAQILVFCGTRSKSEELAFEYSQYIEKCLNGSGDFNVGKVLSFLDSIPLPRDSLGNTLIYDLVEKGTAFHHAGLSRIAQKAVEELFRLGFIRVLFCTETLGAGVNLPAREVIILDTKRWNNEWLSRNVFHQIAGRAGRPNYDLYGKSTILALDRREERTIRKRYWQLESQYSDSLNKIPPQFDHICSRINSKEEFERMILSLIYSRKPDFTELVRLLQDSFLDFTQNQGISTNRDQNSTIYLENISEIYYKLLLKQNTKISLEILSNLEKIYPTENLVIASELSNHKIQSFKIENGKSNFTVSFTNGLLSCSCDSKKIFCKHRMVILKEQSLATIKEILNRNFSFLHSLKYRGYIKETYNGKFQTTTKGSICSEMGVSVKRFEYLKEWLMYELSQKNSNLTETLYEILKLVQQSNEENFFIPNDNFKRPIYEHVILGKEIIDVVKKHQLYEGDLLRIEASVKSIISGLTPLADYLGLKKVANSLVELDKILTEVFKLSF
ncbi:MAG: DEAD/DEAH box helicase [Candidatus Heimdallarchaeota archaeon]